MTAMEKALGVLCEFHKRQAPADDWEIDSGLVAECMTEMNDSALSSAFFQQYVTNVGILLGRRSTVERFMGMRVVPKCRYCGRTEQTCAHKKCDGCGAEK